MTRNVVYQIRFGRKRFEIIKEGPRKFKAERVFENGKYQILDVDLGSLNDALAVIAQAACDERSFPES